MVLRRTHATAACLYCCGDRMSVSNEFFPDYATEQRHSIVREHAQPERRSIKADSKFDILHCCKYFGHITIDRDLLERKRSSVDLAGCVVHPLNRNAHVTEETGQQQINYYYCSTT